MADSDNSTFNTDVTANPKGFVDGMEKAAKAAADTSTDIEKHFKKVADVFDAIQQKMIAVTAVFAGGGALKGAIDDANSWNGEAMKMSKQLGITTGQASVLNVALTRLGIGSDVYTTAAEKLSKQITTNGQAFEVMGVKVKDSAGNYRPITEVMGEVNTKIGQISNTVARDEAGRQAYGKSWNEVRSILKLSDEGMKQAAVRATELGLIVGPQGGEMTKQYSAQMRDLDLVSKSLAIQFGNALLPVFVKTGEWMSKEGPQAGQIFAGIMESVAFAGQSIWMSLTDMGDGLGALAAQAAAILHGDLAAAKAIGRMRDEEAAKNEKTFEEMKKRFGQPIPIAIGNGAMGLPKVDPHYHFKEKDDKPDKGRTGEWEAGLAAKKDAMQKEAAEEGQFRELSKQDEADYWKAILDRTDLTMGEKIQVQRKYYAAESEVRKGAFEGEIEGLNAQREALGKNYQARIDIAQQAYDKIAEAYGKESKEAQKAYGEILKERKALADQISKIDQAHAETKQKIDMADIDSQQRIAMIEAESYGVTAQGKIQIERQFLDSRYQLQLSDMERRLATVDKAENPDEYQKMLDQKIEMETQYHSKLRELDAQFSAANPMSTVITSMQTSFSTAITSMITKAETLRQSLASIFSAILQSFAQQMIAEPLAMMAARMVRETAIYQTMFAQKTTMDATDAATQMATQHAAGVTAVMSNAAIAATAAMASVAAIPVYGWAMAPEVAASTYAAGMGFLPTAAKGFDIPAGVNPLTQLHEREMVLPAKYADTIRGLAGGGVNSGDSGGGDTHHWHINALSPRDFEDFLNRGGGADKVVKALVRARRNGAFTGAI